MGDMAARWGAAKLGPVAWREGKRMCAIYVECEGDPRAEVLDLVSVLGSTVDTWAKSDRERAEDDAKHGTKLELRREVERLTAEAPKRKRAKKGGEDV